MNLKAIGLNVAVATSVAATSVLVAGVAQAATLAPGSFTLTGTNVASVSDFSGSGDTSFNLNFAEAPATLAILPGSTTGVFTSGLSGNATIAPLALTGGTAGFTPFGPGQLGPFSFLAQSGFITGLIKDGQALTFDLAAGTLQGFVNSENLFGFTGQLSGVLRDSSDSTGASALATVFDFSAFSGPDRSDITLTTTVIPTPALLPGLLAMGLGVLRKRNEQQEEAASEPVNAEV